MFLNIIALIFPLKKLYKKILIIKLFKNNINDLNVKGQTPLHTNNNALVIQELINNGAILNVKDNKGRIPLHTQNHRIKNIKRIVRSCDRKYLLTNNNKCLIPSDTSTDKVKKYLLIMQKKNPVTKRGVTKQKLKDICYPVV